ncbi:uncharacterized protein LOC133897110 [Phragmites australis]|uniref:uncharacterized protein LOC133897110 n=1 Tax=Phragmites australis TaxID=29695 RepID=UPI002D77A52D|nr:uncharacterized protein LOC133897110 [Phragmites australis]
MDAWLPISVTTDNITTAYLDLVRSCSPWMPPRPGSPTSCRTCGTSPPASTTAFCFHAVCKPWRDTVPTSHPSFLPWLLAPPDAPPAGCSGPSSPRQRGERTAYIPAATSGWRAQTAQEQSAEIRERLQTPNSNAAPRSAIIPVEKPPRQLGQDLRGQSAMEGGQLSSATIFRGA